MTTQNNTDRDEQQAPERIWIDTVDGRRRGHGAYDKPSQFGKSVEYVRADLVSRASVAAVEKDETCKCFHSKRVHLEDSVNALRCLACPCISFDPYLHCPFTVKHDNCIECDREYEPTAAASSPLPGEPAQQSQDEQVIRLLAAERVANAARQFCEELQEDAEGVPQLQLSELNEALDAWEAYPDARESFDDSQPVMAALASLIEDGHATDHQRRVARLALTMLENRHNNQLLEPERNEIRRAIAESDIAGCTLENADIDALVDLFESWLERRAVTTAPAQPAGEQEPSLEDLALQVADHLEGNRFEHRLQLAYALRAKVKSLRATATPPDTPVVANEVVVLVDREAAAKVADDEAFGLRTIAEVHIGNGRKDWADDAHKAATIVTEVATAIRSLPAAIITRHFAATTAPSETAVGGEAQKCVKCGHDAWNGRYCEADSPEFQARQVPCGCICRFAAPVVAAGDDEGER